ncbi:DoxX family membrane protein [bacterium SCSIO 12741]|nr:DoxX family membrane protein [bacterium SCSIO 12741]
MKAKITMVLRILLGLMMVFFGLNGFFHFMPLPPAPEAAANFMGALVNSGYLMVLVKGLEVIAGLLLIFNLYTRAALTILAPIMLNAFLFHLFLDPAGVGGATLAFGLVIYLIISDWSHFKILVSK